MRIELDTHVACADGAAGLLEDVVIDPTSRRLTHLVVKPHDPSDQVRMMPIQLARDDGASDGVVLECAIATLIESQPIQESAYLRMGDLVEGGSDWTVGIQEIFPLPEYGSLGPEIIGAGMTMEYDQHVTVGYHRIPVGGVEIRRASSVTSSDGHHLGHVVGFVIDGQDTITELILEHGHLWTKRMVAIPGEAIERLQTDELTLSLSADHVAGLKPLPGHHRWG